jgi:hypothetical protein
MAGALAAASSAVIIMAAAGSTAYAMTSGGPAATSAPVAAGCPSAAASGPGIYMYTGNGCHDPVKLTGQPSSVPAEIHTTPVTQDGKVTDYGTIEIGTGKTPPGDGSTTGVEYEGWHWDVRASNGYPLEAQLNWAAVTGWNGDQDITAQNVAGHFQSNEVINGGGGYYSTKCLSFTVPGLYGAFWVQLNPDYNWVPVAQC